MCRLRALRISAITLMVATVLAIGSLEGGSQEGIQLQVPLVLDVARSDQEITVFSARGGNPRARRPQDGDHLSQIAKGDFNGDGLSDLAIGVPNANNGRGEIYLILGRTDIASFPACRDSAFRRCFDAAGSVGPAPDVVIAGASPYYYLGETVGSGNINGDDFADVLVCSLACQAVTVRITAATGLAKPMPCSDATSGRQSST